MSMRKWVPVLGFLLIIASAFSVPWGSECWVETYNTTRNVTFKNLTSTEANFSLINGTGQGLKVYWNNSGSYVLMPHFIGEFSTGSYAQVWLNSSDIDALTNKEILYCYNTTDSTEYGNGSEVFYLDFTDGVDTTGWTNSGCTVAGGVVTCTGGTKEFYTTNTYTDASIIARVNYSNSGGSYQEWLSFECASEYFELMTSHTDATNTVVRWSYTGAGRKEDKIVSNIKEVWRNIILDRDVTNLIGNATVDFGYLDFSVSDINLNTDSCPVLVGTGGSTGKIILDWAGVVNVWDRELSPSITGGYIWAGNATPPAGNETVNITLLAPADSYITLNKTVNFTYQVNTTQNATCNFYRDGLIEFNDTFPQGVLQNTTHIINQTYGLHNWSVYCEQDADASINDTSATRNLEVNFNITRNTPDNGVTLSGNSTFFNYTTDNLYPIICNLTLDTVVIDSENITSAQDTTHTETGVATGSHNWYIVCVAGDEPAYNKTTSSRSFIMNMETFNYTLNLSTVPENVLASPQMIFYDINGDLNALYFVDDSPDDQLVITKIINNTVNTTLTTALNATKQYFVVFREDGYTGILTFSQDGKNQHYINLTNSSLSVITAASAYNATSNDNFDAYTVAYTKQYDTLTYTADSFFLFFVPNDTTTNLVKKYAGNTTLYTVTTANDDPTLSWGTIANKSDLSEWLYVAPKDFGINNKLALYSYNGSAITQVREISSDYYGLAEIEGITVIFERYDDATYIFVSNATDKLSHIEDRIYSIEENVTYELNEHIIDPSHFLFVTEDTFVFFHEGATDTYAFSCYYNTTTLSCTKFPSLEYGTTVPYDRGAFTTAYRNTDNADEITRGVLTADTVTQLHYNRNTYDTKFIMYDEQNEDRRMFTLNLFSDTNAIILTNQSWGWVIPSEQIGNGTQKAYTLGEDGTVRLFITGLSYGYNLDLYTLNITQGAYYTFTVENIFGVPLEGARISAYRYMPSKFSWAIIEQGITDSNGNAVLFLEPLNLYRLVIENSGYVTLNLDYIPTATTDVTIKLDQEGAGSLILPSFEYVFQDVSFSVLPEDITIRNVTNISFQIASNASKLEYYGMRVYHLVNTTSTQVCLSNITTQPSGGILLCEANTSGQYLVTYWFKHEDYDEYTPNFRAYTYTNQSTGFIAAKDYFGDNSPISGWTIYFIGVVLCMLTVGFASRHTIDGAGIAGLVVLWIFTFFAPDAVIAGGLTSTMVTIVTTIATVAGLYIRSYVS